MNDNIFIRYNTFQKSDLEMLKMLKNSKRDYGIFFEECNVSVVDSNEDELILKPHKCKVKDLKEIADSLCGKTVVVCLSSLEIESFYDAEDSIRDFISWMARVTDKSLQPGTLEISTIQLQFGYENEYFYIKQKVGDEGHYREYYYAHGKQVNFLKISSDGNTSEINDYVVSELVKMHQKGADLGADKFNDIIDIWMSHSFSKTVYTDYGLFIEIDSNEEIAFNLAGELYEQNSYTDLFNPDEIKLICERIRDRFPECSIYSIYYLQGSSWALEIEVRSLEKDVIKTVLHT